MDIGKKIVQLERDLAALKSASRLSHASIENTALLVNDGSGSLRAILGVQADGTTAANIVNGSPPPQPSDPIVASVLGGVTVSWNGLFAGGAIIPLDWQRIEVHAAITPVYVPMPATLQDTIETAQGATVVVPCDTPVYVRLVARNTSGTASTPSGTIGPFGPAPVVADDIVDGIVTTLKLADDAVTAAKVATGAIDSDAIAAAAVTATKIGAAAVVAGKIASDAVTPGTIAVDAVTAREVVAGAISTAELAAGAVTANELSAGSVIAGKIAANAVTATTIAAGSVQTAALAADSVAAGKIAADAVTAREIAALAVSTGELDANSITAGKIQAGAVDATALSATAITGKTITGGTITGALIQTAATGQRITLNEAGANKVLVYNSSGTAIGELSDQGLLVKGTNGAILQLDPNNAFPNLKLTNVGQTASAIINVSGTSAVLGMNSGLFTGSTFSDMKWRTLFGAAAGGDFWAAERVRDSATTTIVGGRVYLDDDQAVIGYNNTVSPSAETVINIATTVAQLTNGRFVVAAPASASPALWADAATGHTGSLLRLTVNGTDKAVVDKDGNTTVGGSLNGTSVNVTDTTWQTYTPTVAGQGSGTFTSRTGFYYKLGKLVFFQAEFVMNAAGTGTGTVTVTAPSNIYRTGGRQNIPCHSQSTTTSGAVMNGNAVALETGTGAVIDRISVSNDGTTNRDNVLNGANLLTGARVTIEGWYREA